MKKFFSAILLMTAMVFSAGMFVACNDLVSEVDQVKLQASQNTAAIEAIDSKIADLESRIAAAQSTATAAEAAAKAAKEAGDAAKAEAEAAKAAAATAEANALAAAKEQIETLKGVYDAKVAEIQDALAGKASMADVEAAIAAATKDAQAALDLLTAKVDAKADKTEVEALVAADAAINKEIEALKNFKTLVEELALEEITTNVDSLEADLLAAQAQIDEIWAAVQENYTELYTLIGQNASSITAWGEDLQAQIDGLYAEVFDTSNPNSVMSILASYANIISELQAKVDGLSMLQDRILSIAYVPEVLRDGRGVIDFHSLYVDGVFVNSAPTTATYLVNPTKANLEGVVFEMATRGVETRAAEVATISVAGYEVGQGGKQGRVQLDLTVNGELPAISDQAYLWYGHSKDSFGTWEWNDETQEDEYKEIEAWVRSYFINTRSNQVLATLAATAPNGDVIYSDEAFAQQDMITYYRIINKQRWYADADEDGNPDKVRYYYTRTLPEVAVRNGDIDLVYNESINIYDYIDTYYSGQSTYGLLTDIRVNPTYNVTLLDEYLGPDGVTNQQKFVTFDPETGNVAVNKDFVPALKPAIGRTPIFKVESQILDAEGELVTVATAYVILNIVDKVVEPTPVEPIKVNVKGDFLYTDLLESGAVIEDLKNGRMILDWETVNTQIYDKLGTTHSDFRNNYWNWDVKYLDAEGETYDGPGIEFAFDYDNWNNTDTTYPVVVDINNLIDENTAGSVVVTLYGNGNRRPVEITFEYTVSHEHVWPAFNPDYTLTISDEERAELEIEDMTVIKVKGKLGGENEAKWVLQSEMKEHFENYLDGYENAANHGDLFFYFPMDVTDEYATITGETWKDQEISLDQPLEGDHMDVLVSMGTYLANGNLCTKNYVVRFVNPFVATLTPVTLNTYIAKHDTARLPDHLTIKDLDGNTIYANGVLKANIYGFELSDLSYEFSCEPDASFGDKLKLDPENDWTLDWYNGGTDLQKNKTTSYSVKVAIDGVSVVEAESTVTVLSTANSSQK